MESNNYTASRQSFVTNTRPLLIPIENQVRELDPKLLLAVCAANAGIKSYVGYRTEMDIIISKFPRSIYLAKSLTQRSDKMFRILSKLGHTICAWDEEALVHYPPDIYFKRRLSPVAISYVSHLFAWGQENEDLFRQYPSLPNTLPIYKVGNPRLDMLRKEFEYYYNNEISTIKQKYGRFILLNTNFGNVNAHLPIHNLFTSKDEYGNYKDMGRGATGMGREFSEGRAKFKQTIYEHFLSLITYLSVNFKDTKIIIRPHPVENKDVYFNLAAKYGNVEVVQEGNVIPWIRAATALIHSGCTTGIEAYLSNKPAIAYVPATDPRYGYDAIIPDQLSHQCSTHSDVAKMLDLYLNNTVPTLDSSVLKKYIEFDTDKLSCTNIIEVIERILNSTTPENTFLDKIYGKLLATKRRLIKRVKGISPNSKYHHSYQQVRFPTLNQEQLQAKVDRFAQIINTDKPVTIKQISPHIFLVQ
jgi:surface carbohydrate biosynthesis protein